MSLQSLPFAFSREHGLLLSEEGGRPVLCTRPDAKWQAIAEVRRRVGHGLVVTPVTTEEFGLRLGQLHSHGQGDAAEVIADLGQEVDLGQLITELPSSEDLLDAKDDAPIIRMINVLLGQAVRQASSDIHIEPYESDSAVRFRRDGALIDIARVQRGLHGAMVSRIKIMARLDIAEKRLPQDGRMSLRLGGRQIDVRVSTLPTTHGERVVLRLLDKGNGLRQLADLGMDGSIQTEFSTCLGEPHGILLVTGPTGSGKSTTLYSALQTMDAQHRNIVTVEDPVEYDLPGIAQLQVNPRIDLSFARALRAILRQDPDVIMIGEIRDLETAQIAVQASLTGHLVLATLHTNDAVSAVTRLVDMGIEPFLLASSLRGVLAQRLVRKLCPSCREVVAVDAKFGAFFEEELPATLWQANGCPECARTGFSGRTGIYELMVVDESLQRLIHNAQDEAALRLHARRSGSRSLRADGMRLLRAGMTSVEELLRVTRE